MGFRGRRLEQAPVLLSDRLHLSSDPGGSETPALQEHRPLRPETRKRVAGVSRPVSPGQSRPLSLEVQPHWWQVGGSRSHRDNRG